jgi:chemotaxis regulatin CheY-phosphate phosphatase CheZ
MPISEEQAEQLTQKWDEYEKREIKRQIGSAMALVEHERVKDMAERIAHWNRMYRELLEAIIIYAEDRDVVTTEKAKRVIAALQRQDRRPFDE